eukprot:TRINITY_DN16043_c0_g2_i1.p1 TRINITY_DN16043_c0_g2~~TRINITY_DN16043_c0_g2_i1.p1  ORF type:complete len:654 (+),score=105.14 TRINITY_DN16043_c0_g2_i1:1120-3081(+)
MDDDGWSVGSDDNMYLGTTAYHYFQRLRAEGGGCGLAEAVLRRCAGGIGAWDARAADLPVTVLERLLAGPPPAAAGVLRLCGIGTIQLESVCHRDASAAALVSLFATVGFAAVTRLDLQGACVSDGALAKLLPRLTAPLAHLDLQRCRDVTASAFCACLQCLPHLQTVGIPPRVAPTDLAAVAWETLPRLRAIAGIELPVSLANRIASLTDVTVYIPPTAAASMPRLTDADRYTKLCVNAPGCRLPVDWFDGFTPAAALVDLDVWVDGVVGDGNGSALASLGVCSHLRKLAVAVLGAEDDAVAAGLAALLPRFPNLAELTLTGETAGATDLLMCLPAKVTAFRADDLPGATTIRLQRVPLAAALPVTLAVLSLHAPVGLDAHDYGVICSVCVCLRELILADVPQPAEDFMYALESRSLAYLEVNGCGDAQGADTTLHWDVLLRHLPSLATVLLYGTPPLTLPHADLISRRLRSVSAPTAFGDAPAALGHVPRRPLRYLNLGKDATVTTPVLMHLLHALAPGLEVLQLEHCPRLSGVVPFASCAALTELSLVGLSGMRDSDVAASLCGVLTLRVLVLDVADIRDQTIAAINGLAELHTLSMYILRAAPLDALAARSVRTLKIYLKGVPSLSGAVQAALRHRLPVLQSLTVAPAN